MCNVSRVIFRCDENEVFGRLQEKMENFPGYSGPVIDSVLHGEGAKLIRGNIHDILPVSGRTWKGKKPAAKDAQPFRQEDGELSVTTRTVKNYHYLYFPDDGHTTLRHAGNQQFMYRGAENSASRIIDLCVEELTQELEE